MPKPAFRFHTLIALIHARNKEFYRDKGSLVWAIVFPLLVITAIAFAFGNEKQEVFKIGIYDSLPHQHKHKHNQNQSSNHNPLLQKLNITQHPWVTLVFYDNKQQALTRLKHHQLDLLLARNNDNNSEENNEGNNEKKQKILYWVNADSARSLAAEKLLALETQSLQQQSVSGRSIRYIDWVIPGVLGMNIMFGCLFGIGYVIVRYRKMEVLKRLQATPVTAVEYLSAQVLARLLVVVSISVAIFSGTHLLLDFLMLGSYVLLLLIAVLGASAMIALGLLIASRTDSEELAGGLLNLGTFPMMLLSEVWFSLDNAPQWMQQLSQLLPLTHMLSAARQVMLEGASLQAISLHLWVLGLMTLVLLALASGLFRWSKS